MGHFSLPEHQKFAEKATNACFWYYQSPQSADKPLINLELEEWKAPDSRCVEQNPRELPNCNQNNSEDEDLMEISYEKIEEREERMQLISKKHPEPLNQITPFPRKKLCKEHDYRAETAIDFNSLPQSYTTPPFNNFSCVPDKDNTPSPYALRISKEPCRKENTIKTISPSICKSKRVAGYPKNELYSNLPGFLGRYTILTDSCSEPSFNDMANKLLVEKPEIGMDVVFNYQYNTS